ncbi:RNA-binding S4 domain-containing protein [Parapedobacter soli]|uniref:RNA-binding S4 domain-containing protein n=1 Tax=Parapedobacter soli TaxID=416955 RepID=UPI0021C99FDF|nr:RNA-binding S4 domain-containing protein [Parapedobacter soli]
MDTYQITGEYIQLIQLLKALNWVENGGEAQAAVSAGLVRWNGEVDYRKRLKVRPGDTVEFNRKQVQITESA